VDHLAAQDCGAEQIPRSAAVPSWVKREWVKQGQPPGLSWLDALARHTLPTIRLQAKNPPATHWGARAGLVP